MAENEKNRTWRRPWTMMGGGGASSWNDLKDKPFYSETETITVLERQTFDGFVPDGGGYILQPDEQFMPIYEHLVTSLRPGDELTVFWDGVEYNCPVYDYGFGNFKAMGLEDTGEPFVFICREFLLFYSYTEGTSHEVGITTTRETVHKLDGKYHPAPLTVRIANNGAGDWGADKTVGEIYSAWKNGQTIYFEIVLSSVSTHWAMLTEYGYNDGHIFYCFFDQNGRCTYSLEGIMVQYGDNFVYPE
jgi:hypothetical protein